jgi:hypothetical protein
MALLTTLDIYTALPYVGSMHAVVETPTFLRDCDDAEISDEDRLAIVNAIAAEPQLGDLMQGTGGARKRRFAGRGKGKSGGYRTVSYYAAEDVPVLLLALINKGERANLSKAEQNDVRVRLSRFAQTYRKGVMVQVANVKSET